MFSERNGADVDQNDATERLREDHAQARRLQQALQSLPYVARVLPVETNIVIFELAEAVGPEAFLAYLAARGIKALCFGPQVIRTVFHLDVSDAQLEAVLAALRVFPG